MKNNSISVMLIAGVALLGSVYMLRHSLVGTKPSQWMDPGQVMLLASWKLPTTLSGENEVTTRSQMLDTASIGLIIDKADFATICNAGGHIELTVAEVNPNNLATTDAPQLIYFAGGDPTGWTPSHSVVPGAVLLFPPDAQFSTHGQVIKIRVNCNFPPAAEVADGPRIGVAIWAPDIP